MKKDPEPKNNENLVDIDDFFVNIPVNDYFTEEDLNWED